MSLGRTGHRGPAGVGARRRRHGPARHRHQRPSQPVVTRDADRRRRPRRRHGAPARPRGRGPRPRARSAGRSPCPSWPAGRQRSGPRRADETARRTGSPGPAPAAAPPTCSAADPTDEVADPIGRSGTRVRSDRRRARAISSPPSSTTSFPPTVTEDASMRIAIGADHAGYDLKCHLVETLGRLGHEAIDLGTDSTESVDYPPICAAVARTVVARRRRPGHRARRVGPGRADRRQQGPGRPGRAVQRPLHRPHEPRAQRRQRAVDGRPHRRRGSGRRDPRALARHRLRGRPPPAPGRPDRRHRGRRGRDRGVVRDRPERRWRATAVCAAVAS